MSSEDIQSLTSEEIVVNNEEGVIKEDVSVSSPEQLTSAEGEICPVETQINTQEDDTPIKSVEQIVNEDPTKPETIHQDITEPIGAAESEALYQPLEGNTEPDNQLLEGQTEPVNQLLEAQTEPVNQLLEAQTEPVNQLLEAQTEPVNQLLEGQTEPVNQLLEAQTEPLDLPLEGQTLPLDQPLEGQNEPLGLQLEVKSTVNGDCLTVVSEPTNKPAIEKDKGEIVSTKVNEDLCYPAEDKPSMDEGMESGRDSPAIPISKGAYDIDWDALDENVNPFASKTKMQNSPPSSAPIHNNHNEMNGFDALEDPFKPRKTIMANTPPGSPSLKQRNNVPLDNAPSTTVASEDNNVSNNLNDQSCENIDPDQENKSPKKVLK